MFRPNLNYMRGAYGHMYSRLQEVNDKKDLDILFLGSSHAYRGFDTRYYEKQGFKVFNLGSSSQTPLQTNILLKKYLKKLNPKLIVFEVYPGVFTIDGVESSLDIISNAKIDRYSIKMALEVNNIKVYNTLLYALLREAINSNASYIEKTKKGNDKYVKGGFVEKEMQYFKLVNYPKNKWQFNNNQIANFKNIMAILNEKKIKVILIFAPISSALYESYTNNKKFDSIMKKYGEYYDFNKILSLNDSLHFSDSHHLNQKGVHIFNTKLLSIVNEKQNPKLQ